MILNEKICDQFEKTELYFASDQEKSVPEFSLCFGWVKPTGFVEDNFRHIAIIYKNHDGLFYLLHHWDHFYTPNELFESEKKKNRIDDSFLFTSNCFPSLSKEIDINGDRKRATRALLANIRQGKISVLGEKTGIPYSFAFSGEAHIVVNKQGERVFLNLMDSIGLSCSTFVICVLSAMGVEIINPKSWQVRANDKKEMDKIIASIKDTCQKRNYDLKHVDNMNKEMPCPRIRPEEAFVAAAFFENEELLPKEFHFCESVGKQLLDCT
jgi:hypothetical protein